MARYTDALASKMSNLASLNIQPERLTREFWVIDRTPKLGTPEFMALSDEEFTDKKCPTQQTKVFDRIRKNMHRIDRVNRIRDAWNAIQDRKNEFELQPAPAPAPAPAPEESRGFVLLPQSRAFHIIALDNRRYL